MPFTKIWNTLEGEKKINTDFIHVDFEMAEISKWKLSNRQLCLKFGRIISGRNTGLWITSKNGN